TVEPVPWPTLELPELHGRKLDVVITRLSRPRADDPFGDDLSVETLFADEAVIAAGVKSRWARRRQLSLQELHDACWIGPSQETLTRPPLEPAYQAANMSPPTMRVMTFSVQLRAHLLATGDFVTAMPKSMLKLNPECRELQQLPVRLSSPRFPVVIVTLKGRTLSPPSSYFLMACGSM